jgi:kynurenine formamidase
MTEASFRELYDRLRGQLPWPPQDRRDALNYITPAEVRAAAAEVRLGRPVSLAAPVVSQVTPDNPDPALHQMTGTAQDALPAGLAFATLRLEMNMHGNADTHLDALCHVMYDGHLYNGVPADTVTPVGAVELSVEVAKDGITGRGVLLDIPRLRGVPWLEPGDHVTADDLIAAEHAQQVQVRRGDLLFVRVGHRLRRSQLGPWDAASQRAGLHPAAMEFVAERQVAVLGGDSNNDSAGDAADQVDFPVHVLAINALGGHLLDYLEFAELVPACEQAGRWSFMCVIAPLRLRGGTG